MGAAAADTPAAVGAADGKMLLSLVPEDDDVTSTYDSSSGYNVVKGLKANQELTVALTVSGDPGTAGVQLYFKWDSALKITGMDDAMDAYQVATKWNPNDGSFVFTTGNGKNEKAKDDSIVSYFYVTAPSSGAANFTLDTSRKNMIRPEGPIDEVPSTEFDFRGIKLVVGDDVPEETDPPVQQGTIALSLTADGASKSGSYNTVKAKAGEEVTVELQVANDPGTAGMELYFKWDSGLKITGQDDAADAYQAGSKWNPSDGCYVFTTNTGKNEKAKNGSVITYFYVKMPSTAGKYVMTLNENKKNMVRPEGSIDTVPNTPYAFTGIQFDVSGSSDPEDETTKKLTGDEIVLALVEDETGKSTYTAKPGEEITVDLVVVKNDPGTAGMQLYFKWDSKLKITGMDDAMDAYQVAAKWNPEDGSFVFTTGTGKNEKAANGSVMSYFYVTAPTAEGTYKMTLDESRKNMIRPEGPIDEVPSTPYAFTGLTIKVSNEPEETTTTEPKTPAGSAAWTIGTVEAASGETGVKVPVTVSGDSGTAGFVVKFQHDKALTFKGFEWTNGYTGDATVNDGKLKVVWASDDSADQKASKTIMNLIFDAPTEGGTYPVEFSGKVDAVNTSALPLTITTKNGAVVVADPTTTLPDAGEVQWIIGKVNADAGQTGVKVPVTVSGDPGTAGFVVKFKHDAALKFEGFEWKNGYTGEAMLNGDKLVVVWASSDSENEKADDDVAIMNLIFTAPDEEGVYPVEFVSTEVVNTNASKLKVKTQDGAVIVGTPITTTTTKDEIAAGSDTWKIATVEATKGQAGVKVPVTVEGDPGTAGFVVKFQHHKDLEFKGFEWGKGYTGDAVLNNDKLVVVWASEDSENQKAAADTPIINLIFDAPDAAGKYPVEFKVTPNVVDTNAKELTVKTVNGAVVIPDESTTTTVTTTTQTPGSTTTTVTTVSTPTPGSSEPTDQPTTAEPIETTTTYEPLPAGTVGWYIGKVNAASGATGVKVPVTVRGDAGTAGFVVKFAHDEALKFKGFEWGDGYTGEAMLNGDKLVVVWASEDSADQKAANGAVVLNLIFDAPEAAGTYPVTFATAVSAVNTDAQPLTVKQYDGYVKIEETTTTTTVTTPNPGSNEPTGTTTTVTTPNPGEIISTDKPTGTTTTVTTTTEVTTTTTTAPKDPVQHDPGHVVYQIDDVNGVAGMTAKVPVFVWHDPGTAGFELQFEVPAGFKISGYEWGDAYPKTETNVTWNADVAKINWDNGDGNAVTAEAGKKVLTLLVDVPADAKGNETYPVNFVKSSIRVADTNGKSVEYSTVDGSIYIIDIQPVEPGTVGFVLGDVTGAPGETVKVPLTLLTTEGITGFSVQLDVPDGFDIGDLELGKDLSEAGTFSWDPATKTLTWTSKDGKEYFPAPGELIATIPVTIPKEAEEGTYQIKLGEVKATGADGAELKKIVKEGTLTVTKIVTVVATDISFTSREPDRLYYWSHDERTFAEAGGLEGMQALLTIKKYYTTEDGKYVDADGKVVNAPVYFETLADIDVTEAIVTAVNTPKAVWDADGPEHTNNKFQLAFNLDPSKSSNAEVKALGTDPIHVFDHKIFIGVKGDANLDNFVDPKDATLIQKYYNAVTINEESYTLNDDPELDGLAFFLADVHLGQPGKWDNPTTLDPKDATSIQKHYNFIDLNDEPWNWATPEIVGYDFPDNFPKHGWPQAKEA